MSKIKRILVISPMSYGPPWREGVSNLARRLVDFLIQRQLEVIVLSPETMGDGPNSFLGEFGEAVIHVDCGTPTFWMERLKFWTRMLFELRHLKYKVDAIFLFASASMTLGFKTRLIKFFGTTPLVVYVTALGDPPVFVNSSVFADRVFIISPFLQKWFPHAEVVYPFLPTNIASSAQKSPESETNEVFRFLFLGALERERGIEDLLEAFSIASRRSARPMHLTLAWNEYGSYGLEYIDSLLSDLKIRKSVQISGIVDTEEAYRKCDVVVIPHIRETRMAFPVRIIESLYMRKPLIVTDACGMGSLIKGCGLTVRRANSEAMAAAIVRLAEDSALYKVCVSNCSARLEEYDSMRSLTRLQGIIEELIT